MRVTLAAAYLSALIVLTGGVSSAPDGRFGGMNSQQTEAAAADEPMFEYTGLAYNDLDSKRLRLRLNVRLRSPKNNLVLLRMEFENVTANELPLAVEPFEGTVELKTDEAVELPSPLYIAIYFRELSSLDPLRKLLETRQVLLRGTANVTMKFKGVEGVFTLGQNLTRSFPFEKAVPLDLLDHPVARVLAQALLDEMANPNSLLGTRWLEQQLQVQALLRRGEDLEPGLALIQTHYRILDPTGSVQRELQQSGVGFFLAPERVVTPKRVLEPWKYVPEIAYLQQRSYQVELTGYDIAVWSEAGAEQPQQEGGTVRRLTPQQLQVEEKPADEMVSVEYDSPEGKVAVPVHRLDSPQGLVLVRLRGKSPASTPLPTLALEEADETPLGIVYFGGAGQSEPAKTRTSWALAKMGPEGAVLDRRFPDSAAGAPLFDPRGQVRAIFVGENRCLPIQSATALAERKP